MTSSTTDGVVLIDTAEIATPGCGDSNPYR